MQNYSVLMIFLAVLLFQSCLADLRPALIKNEGITSNNTSKGKSILLESWEKQGFDELKKFESYAFQAEDTWKGMMGKMGKPWPEAKSNMLFKFEVGSFDGQVKYLDGKKANTIAGLQSWNYYEYEVGEKPQQLEMNKRARFGISAYQYFFEMLDRVKNAPIISWAGTEKFNDAEYDIIFVTWHDAAPHMQNDQYQLMINKQTKLLDFVIYTLRENYLKMPAGRAFYGSVRYDDYQKVDGILIPHTQTVFLNKPKKKIKKNLHQLKVSNFEFDSFDLTLLKPFADIQATGDSKEKG